MRRFLMIAPHFPPCGAVAAKRALCFARNLPAEGWEPAVIALPESIQRDAGLISLIPDVPIYRYYRGGPIAWFEDAWRRIKRTPPPTSVTSTKPTSAKLSSMQAQTGVSLEQTAGELAPPEGQRVAAWRLFTPSYWIKELDQLPIDRYAKYIPTLIPGALRFLRAQRCEAIYATGGPFSTFFLAYTLSKMTGLPMVLDLRDPLTVDPIYAGRWSERGRRFATRLERKYFRHASAVILNTRSSRDAYRHAYRDLLPAEHFSFIRNHFDPDLFDPHPPTPTATGPFKIVFYGHLTPIRNARLFLDALRAFIDERSLSPEEIQFYTLGDRTSDDNEQVQRLKLQEYVNVSPWLPFTRSRSLLGTCDLLLDLTSELHHLRISGKFYDYLAAERPILCISESAEYRALFDELKVGEVVYNQESEVVAALGRFYEQKRHGAPFIPNHDAVYQMSARPAAKRLAETLNQITEPDA